MIEIDVNKVFGSSFDKEHFVLQNEVNMPPFLTNYFDEVPSEKLIFIHKKPLKQECLDDTLACKEENDSFTESSISYIGQPLECPFSPIKNISLASEAGLIKESIKKEIIEAVSFTEARALTCSYSLSSLRSEEFSSYPPLWVLCKPNTLKKTDAVKKTDARKAFLMSVSNQEKWRSGSWAVLHSWNVEDKSIDKLIAEHSTLFHVSRNKCKLLVTATYVPEIDLVNQAVLKVMWTTPSFEVPCSTAKTKLLLNFKVGYPESKIKPLWDQLLLLQKFLDVMIVMKKEGVDLQNPESGKCFSYKFNESDVGPHAVEEQLTALLRDSSQGIPYSNHSSSKVQGIKDYSFLNVVDETVTNQRQATDFTDEIWNVLKDCSTYHDLRKYIEMIFHQVRRGALVPIIQRCNGTRIAHVLRCLIADSAFDFELTVNPLEYLIEMGIEKLKNDFINIFSSMITHNGKLSMPSVPSLLYEGGLFWTHHDFLKSFKDVRSSEISWTDACALWLTWLGRMYTCLEMLVLAQQKLSLKCQGIDANLLSLVYQILDLHSSTKSPISSLPWLFNNTHLNSQLDISTTSVSDIIKFQPFEQWKVCVASEGKNSKQESVFLCCDQDRFPPCILDPAEPCGDNETLNGTAFIPRSFNVCSSLHTSSECFN